MRRLLLFTVGFAAGCLIAVYLVHSRVLYLIALAALVLAAAARFVQIRFFRQAFLVLLGLGLSLLWCRGYQKLLIDPVFSEAGTRDEDYAVVCSYSRVRNNYHTVEAEMQTAHRSVKVSLSLRNCDQRLTPGDLLIGDFQLRPSNRTYDGAEYLYLQSRGILLTGSCKVSEVQKIGHMPLAYYPLVLSERIRNRIDSAVPKDAAPFLKAILTGDRSSLSFGTEQDLSVAGLSHVVAVSGMHVSLLIGILYILLGRGGKRTALIGIPVLIVYMLMTGMSPSVVRASVMLIILLLAPLVGRENDLPTSLSAAALLLLVQNPWIISNVGFQLSFLSVTGLLLFSGPLYSHFQVTRPWAWFLQRKMETRKCGRICRILRYLLRKLVNWILGSICATIGALAFTTPVIVHVFGKYASYALLSNILALWAVAFCFAGGLAAVFLSLFFLPFASVIGWLTAWPVRYLLWVSRMVAGLPMASLPISSVYTKVFLVLSYLVLFCVIVFREKRYGMPLLCVLAAQIGAALFLRMDSKLSGTVTITALDVGQGECICVLTDEMSAMIDCGGSSADQTGAYAAEYLNRAGVRRLDYLILTHYDSDHIGGVPELLREVTVGTIFLPDIPFAVESRDALAAEAARQGTDVRLIREDSVVPFGDGTLTIFAPVSLESDNAACASVLYSLGEYDMLATGDLDEAAEHRLLESHQLPKVEVYIAGHHGSATSSGMELLQTIQPETVLISVGRNSYGHPAAETLQRFAALGIAVYRTDLSGDLEIRR